MKSTYLYVGRNGDIHRTKHRSAAYACNRRIVAVCQDDDAADAAQRLLEGPLRPFEELILNPGAA